MLANGHVGPNQKMASTDMIANVVRLMADNSGTNTVQKHHLQRTLRVLEKAPR